MGHEIAEAEPEAMAVFDARQPASGLDLQAALLPGPAEELTQTEVQQPALVATSLAIRGGARRAGSSRTTWSATPSASSRRSRRQTR